MGRPPWTQVHRNSTPTLAFDSQAAKLLRGPDRSRPVHFVAPVGHVCLWSDHLCAPWNITCYIIAVLHSHSDVLTSTSIQNGEACCGLVHTMRVDGPCSRPSTRVYSFFSSLRSRTSSLHLQNRDWPRFCLIKPTVCLTRPLFTSFRRQWFDWQAMTSY